MLTRRDFLSSALAVGLTAGVAGQVPVPSRGRIASGKRVLAPSDLRFLGFTKFPDQREMFDHLAGVAFPQFAFRRVGGQARFFTWGGPGSDFSDYRVWELELPTGAPSVSVARAPSCSVVRNWGNVTRGFANADGSSGIFPSGLAFDESRNALVWNYGGTYVVSQPYPTVGVTVPNDAAGTTQTFGPWRTQAHQNMTCGPLTQIPEAFARAYTGGKRLGIVGAQVSGNAASPFGASLTAHDLPPLTTKADRFDDGGAWTLASHPLLQHPLAHPQARDTKFRWCRFVRNGAQPYSCEVVTDDRGTYGGATLEPGTPWFGGAGTGDAFHTGSGTTDAMTACAWVDLPDVHGLCYFGQLATTPIGYRAPNDDEGLIHRGYAALPAPAGIGACCHGQDDPFNVSTGPWAHAMMPMLWIYDPDDLIATAEGRTALWGLTPTSTTQLIETTPALQCPSDTLKIGRFPQGAISAAGIDPVTRRLYAVVRFMDNSSSWGSSFLRPVLASWEIA